MFKLPRMRYRSHLMGLTLPALLYPAMTWVVMWQFSSQGTPILQWPPGWLALVLLLLGGTIWWPGVLLGSFIAALLSGMALPAAALIAPVTTLLALLVVRHLTHRPPFNPAFQHPRDYLRLIAAAAVAGAFQALAQGALPILSGAPMAAPAALFSWWQDYVLGILLMVPALLIWRAPPYHWRTSHRMLEALAGCGLILLIGYFVFLGDANSTVSHYAKAFLLFAPMTWAAIRLGRHGVFLVIVLTGLLALYGSAHDTGFFATDLAYTGLTSLRLYLLLLLLVGLALDFSLDALRRAEQRERTRSQILEIIARDAPLLKIMQTIVTIVERENRDISCCIQLMGEDGRQFFCGSATSTATQRHSADRQINVQAEIGACCPQPPNSGHPALPKTQPSADVTSYAWSCPIKSYGDKVIGHIYASHKIYTLGFNEDTRLIEQIADLATMAVERSHDHERLQQSALIYQNSSEGMVIIDANGIIISANPSCSALTGYDTDELVGRSHRMLLADQQDPAVYRHLRRAVRTSGHWQGELQKQRKGGITFTAWLTVNAIYREDRKVHRYIAIFSDISGKKAAEAVIWKQANFDALTGLPNRYMFTERLEQEIKKAQRSGSALALLFIDVDHFKEVNDAFGHSAGDLLLIEAAKRIVHCVRETDMVARFGGDEFTAILTHLDRLDSIERVARNILLRLSQPFQLRHETVSVSASIGIAWYPDDATDTEALLKNADQAMYAAKHEGRNRYSYFAPSMQNETKTRLRLANDLRHALDQNQLQLFYQPIIDLQTGAMSKAEVLLRWQHPSQGWVAPDVFIAIAEHNGMIADIGDWVFRQAAMQLLLWQPLFGPDFQLSVNKSPVQFNTVGAAQCSVEWPECLDALGLPPNSIALEITEGLLLEANDNVAQQIRRLHEGGLLISIDDFGTGYSALASLKKFDIDFLKIDRAFIQHLAPDSEDMALCEAIIVMAHKLGIKVTAEGVETQAQCALLRQAGCDYAQGFLFSPALSVADLEALFRNNNGKLPVEG